MDKKAYQEQEKKHVAAMKKAGVPKSIVKEEMKEAGMKKGGEVAMPEAKSMGKLGMMCGGKVKGYAKGGSVRGDGICQRGKTKGTMR